MVERYFEEEGFSTEDRSLEGRLKDYPELKAKIEAMLAIIENAGGDVEKAAEAEQRIIEEMRPMGNEGLHSWARRQQQKKEDEYQAQPGVNRKRKKTLLVYAAGKNRNKQTNLHAGTAGWADSTVCEVGRGELPWLLARLATGDDRFRSG